MGSYLVKIDDGFKLGLCRRGSRELIVLFVPSTTPTTGAEGGAGDDGKNGGLETPLLGCNEVSKRRGHVVSSTSREEVEECEICTQKLRFLRLNLLLVYQFVGSLSRRRPIQTEKKTSLPAEIRTKKLFHID